MPLKVSGSIFDDDSLGGASTDACHALDAILFARSERFVFIIMFCRRQYVEDIHRANIRTDAVSVTKVSVHDNSNHFLHR